MKKSPSRGAVLLTTSIREDKTEDESEDEIKEGRKDQRRKSDLFQTSLA